MNTKTALLILFVAHLAYAGQFVNGVVTNADGSPISGVTLLLDDQYGNTFSTVTNTAGEYSFSNFIEGHYYLRPADSGLEMEDGGCAYQVGTTDTYASTDIFVPFVYEAVTGVVVDFGTTSESIYKSLSLVNNQFSLNMNLNNFSGMSTTPDRVVVEGRWSVPGVGDLDTQVIGANLNGLYAGTLAQATYTNQADGDHTLSVSRSEWPYLNMDGNAANFQFQISSTGLNRLQAGNYNAVFCVTYTVYVGQQIVHQSNNYWQGTIQ